MASDAVASSIKGGPANVTAPAVVTHFAVITEEHADLGKATRVKVVALDMFNQEVRGYTGTVHFTSSDTGATLPADYTFVAADRGKHEFLVQFSATGTQTLTATDTTQPTLTGQSSVVVRAADQPDNPMEVGQDLDHHGGPGLHGANLR